MATEEEQYPEYTEIEEATNEYAEGVDKKEKLNSSSYAGIHSANFEHFHLKQELLLAIRDCGFEHPSEVQQDCIPKAIMNMDIICQAKSGMGKTAVFVLSVLHQMGDAAKITKCDTLIIAHTRELVHQIRKEFERFAKYMKGIRVMGFFGGLPESEDFKNIAAGQPHIAIGCPGRLKNLIESVDPKTKAKREHFLDLSGVKRFVMDECDALLSKIDMRKDVQTILLKTPRDKQVMMFSATLDATIRPTCKKFTKNALEVFIDDDSKLTLHGLQQYSVDLPENKKNRRLTQLLDDLEFNQVIIFVKDVKRCIELSNLLRENNFPTIAVHGGIKKQEERLEMYNSFKDYKSRIMVATDLFGRGVDFEHVNIVVNYDMPKDPEQYLHRVGRSARFGTKGLAISFVAGTEDTEMMEKVKQKFNMEVPALPATIDPSSYMGTS